MFSLKLIKGNLKPNPKSKKQLQFISKGCNEVYNHFLKKRIKTDKKKQPQPTFQQQQKELTQLKQKKKYKWLNTVCARTLQEVVKNRLPMLERNTRNIKQSTSRLNTPEKNPLIAEYDSFSIHQDGYQIKDNQLFLSQGNYERKRQPKIITPFELTNPLKGTPKIITISWKYNNWTVNITCDIEISPRMSLAKIIKVLGIDRGVRKILATSEGKKLPDPKYWKEIEEKYIELQRSLSRKVKGSNNWKKVKSEMSTIGKGVSNRMKDLNHKTI